MSISFISIPVIFFVIIYIITQFRKVVPTNEAHVVKNSKRIITYGKNVDGGKNGNVYIAWPEGIPVLGVSIKRLPLSIFNLEINGFKCYDSEKNPFKVNVVAFLNISELEIAAEKIETIVELQNQLEISMKLVVRKVLASRKIEKILEEKTEIKDELYRLLFSEVKKWGVKLQNIEFMEIFDIKKSETGISRLEEKELRIKERELENKEKELIKREKEITKKEIIINKKLQEENGKEEKSILFS